MITGIFGYFSDSANIFDAFVTLLSVVDIILEPPQWSIASSGDIAIMKDSSIHSSHNETNFTIGGALVNKASKVNVTRVYYGDLEDSGGAGASALRAFRLFRLLRLFTRLEVLHDICHTCANTVPVYSTI